MITKVVTRDIQVKKWKNKIKSADLNWLAMQYRGLKYLLDEISEEFEYRRSLNMAKYGDIIPDDVYKETFYQLEDEMLDLDFQLVDVEDEFERRGIEIT